MNHPAYTPPTLGGFQTFFGLGGFLLAEIGKCVWYVHQILIIFLVVIVMCQLSMYFSFKLLMS